jgi:acyl-coenzyme A synthetase/AMP-(fatty) acid ligase
MHYTYGLSIINSHLLVGATILMTDKAMVNKQFWDYMKVEKATSFGGVPFTYELLKKIRFFKMDLPDLRYLTQAGGKLPTNLHQEFATWAAENGKKFVVMYGQTEATARMAYLPAEESLRKCGSMGKVIPGGTFILVGVDGKEITEPNQVGELVYEGDNVTLGYAECSEDLAKGDERGGRLETGDMARIDEEGFYYIVGRKKRFLKIFGNRVNLDEIDQLIKVNFEGLDCASTGVDDHMKTFITDENQVVPVRQFLSRITHLSESAFEVHAIAEIPKNEAGKTLYKDLPV